MNARRTLLVVSLASLSLPALAREVGKPDREGWMDLFDGKSLTGWKKAEESPGSWKVADGCLVANGNRCHLYWVGDGKPFTDFELRAEVKTEAHSNSGIYFHTRYQARGWPKHGFEVQVNNTFHDPQKTASLYGVVPITKAPARDGEWFELRIVVRGKRVRIAVDGKQLVDYTEPAGKKPGRDFARVFDKGTFALQAHDPGSTVRYRRIRVRRLGEARSSR